jgi:general secretion pathway protein G
MEIMLVLAIISVLLGFVIKQGVGFLGEAHYVKVRADVDAITTLLRTYEMRSMSLPTTEQGLQALVTRPNTEPVPKRWGQLIETLPTDPWNHPYQYRNPGKHNPNKFDIYSLGPDGTESADDQGNWE